MIAELRWRKVTAFVNEFVLECAYSGMDEDGYLQVDEWEPVVDLNGDQIIVTGYADSNLSKYNYFLKMRR